MVVRGKRRKKEREERRASILDAARKVFDRRGVAAATMDEVASTAELSKGTLYLYFHSKDELFLALGSRVLDDVIAAFEELGAVEQRTGLQRFRTLLRLWSRIALQHPHTMRNMFKNVSRINIV